MDGNYKSVYPKKQDEEEPKPKWPNERMQKRAEEFEKGFNKAPGPFDRLLKKLFGDKKEEK
jgi:hypothetical protein